MNRRGFFTALLGAVGAVATGQLLPTDSKKTLLLPTLEKVLANMDVKALSADCFRPMSETERAYIEVDRLERRVQAILRAKPIPGLDPKVLWIDAT